METCKVFLVRHGESEWNKLNLFCGWHDVNLSEKGIWDAVTITSTALLKENCQFDVAFTSALKRSQKYLEVVLNSMHLTNSIEKYSAWQLNERHYGALTGFNKRQMADSYGEKQVQEWRRSYDVCPPEITPLNTYYNSIRTNPKFECIPEDDFPYSESLETTIKRVVPFWENCIVPKIQQRKKILIVAHGTSLRGIIKYIEGMSVQQIMKFNVPNAIPFCYEFDVKTMKVVGKIKFLADDKTVESEMERVGSIGKRF